MKKIFAILLAVVLVAALGVTAFAEGINTDEQKLIDYCKAEYQTKEDGVYIKLPDSFVQKAETYLNMVDISAAQFANAETQIKNLETLIRTDLTVSPDAKTLEVSEVTDSFYNDMLVIFKNLATAVGASIKQSEDFDRTNPDKQGTFMLVQSNTDEKAVVYIFGSPATSGFSTPVIIASAAAVVVAVAVVAVIIAKKKTSVNA